jgi:hypothetical protein
MLIVPKMHFAPERLIQAAAKSGGLSTANGVQRQGARREPVETDARMGKPGRPCPKK